MLATIVLALMLGGMPMRQWNVTLEKPITESHSEDIVIGSISLTTCADDQEIIDTLIKRGFLFEDAERDEIQIRGDSTNVDILLRPHDDLIVSLVLDGPEDNPPEEGCEQ
jgi:hypothetical protein